MAKKKVVCGTHGEANLTFVCQHIAKGTARSFRTDEEPTRQKPWPDAFCAACDDAMKAAGDWTDEVGRIVGVTVVCHFCYEEKRKRLR